MAYAGRAPWQWVGTEESWRLQAEPAFWTPDPVPGWRVYPGKASAHLADHPSLKHRVGVAARCKRIGEAAVVHKAPDPLCTCGYYAWRSLSLAVESLVRDFAHWPLKQVWVVHMSGLIIEHERGYRAEFMEPVEQVDVG